MIGGAFGNNQQSQTIMTIPEEKCKNVDEFLQGACSPCPIGSTLGSNFECEYCHSDQYFDENFDSFFKSSCKYCPLGTVGGQGNECVPCSGGFIFENTKCKWCNSSFICPIGTKYQFPKKDFESWFHETWSDNLPKVFSAEGEKVDVTPYISISLVAFLSLVLLIGVKIFLSTCWEKALFIFKELDLVGITGGQNKWFLGGVVTLYYFLFVVILCLGFISSYIFFNAWLEMTEYQASGKHEILTSGWIIEIKLYSSIVTEKNT